MSMLQKASPELIDMRLKLPDLSSNNPEGVVFLGGRAVLAACVECLTARLERSRTGDKQCAAEISYGHQTNPHVTTGLLMGQRVCRTALGKAEPMPVHGIRR